MPLAPLTIRRFTILLIFSLSRMVARYFDMPTKLLTPVISSMRRGQFASKIETTQQVSEIQHITETFNEMIGEIQNLRINIYEEQIAHRDLELQYLKTQIAPHFLINCLNTIFVLSQKKASKDITRELIQTLSEHLRYTLAARNAIALSEEIYYVENYIRLTQLRFPESLDYQIQISPIIREAEVFPLILLMLTENSVKTGVVMGESFHIRITGEMYEKNAEKRIHLVHIDSGCGFEEKNLELYNDILNHPDVRKNGYSIGIYNITRRIKLAFGESAYIWFSNEPEMGARIDLDFPFVPYTEL